MNNDMPVDKSELIGDVHGNKPEMLLGYPLVLNESDEAIGNVGDLTLCDGMNISLGLGSINQEHTGEIE